MLDIATSRRLERRDQHPCNWKAGRCRKAGCRTARTARRSPIRQAHQRRAPIVPVGGYKGCGLCDHASGCWRAAQPRRVRPRRQRFRRAARRRAQCRAIRDRARRRALPAARRCSRPRSTATCAILRRSQAAAGRRRNPRAGAGACGAPRPSGEKNGVPLSRRSSTQVDEVAKSLGITPLSARGHELAGRRRTSAQGSPFWRFSLRFYRQPGVADACIALQEERGRRRQSAAVPALAGERRARALTVAEVAALEARIGAWRDVTVIPLRARAARAEVAAARWSRAPPRKPSAPGSRRSSSRPSACSRRRCTSLRDASPLGREASSPERRRARQCRGL